VIDEALEEKNEQYEEDLIDLLASQSEQDDGEGNVDEIPDELPDDPDELRAILNKTRDQVRKRNRIIRQKDKTSHRKDEELEALQRQIDELRNNSTNASNVEAQKQEQQKAIDEWRDSVSEDPSKAVDFATWQANEMQSRVVDYLAQMQQSFNDQIASIKGEINPTRQKYRGKIEQLKLNPKFAGFSDDQLMVLAESLSEVKPRGSIGGKPIVAEKAKEQKLEELRKRAREYLQNGLG
jgi:SMC interacting uncharacterized protein involved in chromosome segregation